MTKKATEGTTTYLVLAAKGDFVLELPEHYRLTFAAGANPTQMNTREHCLRVWEGERLRAVFADVRGFRDMAIPLARKVERETGASSWAHDSSGNFKSSTDRAVETELIPERF